MRSGVWRGRPQDGREINCSAQLQSYPGSAIARTTSTYYIHSPLTRTRGCRATAWLVLAPVSGTREPPQAGAMCEAVCATSRRRHNHTCHIHITGARHGRNRKVGCTFWLQDGQGGQDENAKPGLGMRGRCRQQPGVLGRRLLLWILPAPAAPCLY